MAHYEGNIRSGIACGGPRGIYTGTVHYLSDSRRHDIKQTDPVFFGTAKTPGRTPALWIQEALEQTKTQQEIVIEPERVIAASILRYCWMTHHVEPEANPALKARWERVGSFAVAHSVDDVEELQPLGGRERNLSPHGIGHARRVMPGTTELRLVHLPVTPVERTDYPVLRAVRAAPQAQTLSRQPYVALHGREETLEQIVLLRDLQ